MKIIHSAVTSPVFELVKTIELDIQFGEDSWTTRVELFRDTEREDVFRCHVWELELFHLRPSFPRDDHDEPAHVTDDTIMVERGIAGSNVASIQNEPFLASSIDSALQMVLDD